MATFLQELQRRNVVRVGVAYLVVGWLAAQVGDLVLGAFESPPWMLQVLIVVLALGLPVSMTLAWLFELTPEGIRSTDAVDGDAGPDARRAKRPVSGRARLAYAAIVVVLLISLGLFGGVREFAAGRAGHGEQVYADATPIRRSIAVLPFTDLSESGDHGWFVDGLTEEVTNALTRIPDMLVAARTSAYAASERRLDVRAIGETLDVAYVLEGSVRRSDERLRVAAQLVRAADGFHVWSQTYDRTPADVIDVQEEVAAGIAIALKTATDPEALDHFVSSGTSDVLAFDAYLQGLAHEGDALATGDFGHLLVARDSFERAVAIDPGFAKAWWRLSTFWLSQLDAARTYYGLAGLPREEMRARYQEAIDNAIRHAHDPVSRIRYEAERAQASLELDRALRLALEYQLARPNDHDGQLLVLGLLSMTGRYEEAAAAAFDFLDNDSPSAEVTIDAITALVNVPDPERQRRLVDMALARVPDNPHVLYQTHRALLWAGDYDRARGLLDRIMASPLPAFMFDLAALRQACADGQADRAAAIYAAVLGDPGAHVVSVWLTHKVMGADTAAEAQLVALDDAADLSMLASFLNYGFFDARPYPNLAGLLERQGIDRGEPLAIPYRCNR